MSKLNNWDLAYWQSGEWQVIEERLADAKDSFVPARGLLFRSLELLSPREVRVCILGQDPYPNPRHASGVPFSVPDVGYEDLPPTLKNIFTEYSSDLGYPTPKNGDLTKWVNQGVFLWNVYPSCFKGRPGSHHWPEWELLTEQVIHALPSGTVQCLLGNSARAAYSRACGTKDFVFNGPSVPDLVIATSHPSPRGVEHGFRGSKIFSRINALLDKPIDWRLE